MMLEEDDYDDKQVFEEGNDNDKEDDNDEKNGDYKEDDDNKEDGDDNCEVSIPDQASTDQVVLLATHHLPNVTVGAAELTAHLSAEYYTVPGEGR